MPIEDEVRRATTHALTRRLPILGAVVNGLQRHAEVSAAVAAAPDKVLAREAVADLLEVDEIGARAVLDRRIEDLQQTAVRAYQDEYAAITAELERRRAEPQ